MMAEWLDPRQERVPASAVSRNGVVATGRAIAVCRRHHKHDRERGFLTEVIDAIDAIVDDLEHLHLLDLHRVPAAYRTRLERLTASLPSDVRCELGTGIPIASLMESLWTVQGKLMTRRSRRTGDAGHAGAEPRSAGSDWPWSSARVTTEAR
jgi:hypothetical protein